MLFPAITTESLIVTYYIVPPMIKVVCTGFPQTFTKMAESFSSSDPLFCRRSVRSLNPYVVWLLEEFGYLPLPWPCAPPFRMYATKPKTLIPMHLEH